jgi:hypothetical protein
VKRFVAGLGVVLLSMGLMANRASALVRLTASAPTWTKIATAKSPPKRASFAMAYDPVSSKVVLFGGYGPSGYFADTWTFDGTSWVKQSPSAAPAPRAGSAMTFDAKSKALVLFGGFNGKYLGDTWMWNGATSQWSQVQPAQSPAAMTGPALFTDPLDHHADLFGGYGGVFYYADTWRWTGTTWRKLRRKIVPYGRSEMVYGTNPRTRSTVVFAGLGSANPDNTWTWDGMDWTQQSPSLQPASVYDAASAYDRSMNAILKFGGGSGGVDLNDTWAWNGAAWTQLSPTTSPSARESVRMAYDAALGHVVLFGGIYYSGAQFFNDTWEFAP